MTGRTPALLLVALLLAIATPAVLGSTRQLQQLSATQCRTLFSYNGAPASVPFLFFADPGSFSGTPEAKYFQDLMPDLRDRTSTFPACGHVSVGTLLRQRVAIVQTGIGPTTAGMCTQQILDKCGGSVRFAIYMGTSGWSPAVGGLVTPPLNSTDRSTSCTTGNSAAASRTRIVRVGDLCVSPISMNWMCTQASWSQQCLAQPAGNLCFRPRNFFGPDASFLYGKCFFVNATAGSIDLSNQLLQVARSGQFAQAVPTRNAAVHQKGVDFWTLNANGSGIAYPILQRSDPPTVFDYNTCVEVDGQFFYSGVPWEITARDWSAMAIKMAGFRRNATALDVIAVSAMEAIGFMEAFENYNMKASTPIPYTNVRGNSNWLHHPIRYSGNGVWAYNDDSFSEDFANGYGYAIASYSALVLQFFKNRCLASNPASAASVCNFTMAYA